eukprot:TRINITY_DN2300_c0_g1_i1.p1 TRINITY_DN2300_c0_g1~~TRINITY_DN2300_c0_g1_i1.p1  ORF type:complete len:1051 (-),score=206.71 TRINITY_DN2300_c0_g1_i1:450-3602(-)
MSGFLPTEAELAAVADCASGARTGGRVDLTAWWRKDDYGRTFSEPPAVPPCVAQCPVDSVETSSRQCVVAEQRSDEATTPSTSSTGGDAASASSALSLSLALEHRCIPASSVACRKLVQGDDGELAGRGLALRLGQLLRLPLSEMRGSVLHYQSMADPGGGAVTGDSSLRSLFLARRGEPGFLGEDLGRRLPGPLHDEAAGSVRSFGLRMLDLHPAAPELDKDDPANASPKQAASLPMFRVAPNFTIGGSSSSSSRSAVDDAAALRGSARARRGATIEWALRFYAAFRIDSLRLSASDPGMALLLNKDNSALEEYFGLPLEVVNASLETMPAGYVPSSYGSEDYRLAYQFSDGRWNSVPTLMSDATSTSVQHAPVNHRGGDSWWCSTECHLHNESRSNGACRVALGTGPSDCDCSGGRRCQGGTCSGSTGSCNQLRGYKCREVPYALAQGATMPKNLGKGEGPIAFASRNEVLAACTKDCEELSDCRGVLWFEAAGGCTPTASWRGELEWLQSSMAGIWLCELPKVNAFSMERLDLHLVGFGSSLEQIKATTTRQPDWRNPPRVDEHGPPGATSFAQFLIMGLGGLFVLGLLVWLTRKLCGATFCGLFGKPEEAYDPNAAYKDWNPANAAPPLPTVISPEKAAAGENGHPPNGTGGPPPPRTLGSSKFEPADSQTGFDGVRGSRSEGQRNGSKSMGQRVPQVYEWKTEEKERTASEMRGSHGMHRTSSKERNMEPTESQRGPQANGHRASKAHVPPLRTPARPMGHESSFTSGSHRPMGHESSFTSGSHRIYSPRDSTDSMAFGSKWSTGEGDGTTSVPGFTRHSVPASATGGGLQGSPLPSPRGFRTEVPASPRMTQTDSQVPRFSPRQRHWDKDNEAPQARADSRFSADFTGCDSGVAADFQSGAHSKPPPSRMTGPGLGFGPGGQGLGRGPAGGPGDNASYPKAARNSSNGTGGAAQAGQARSQATGGAAAAAAAMLPEIPVPNDRDVLQLEVEMLQMLRDGVPLADRKKWFHQRCLKWHPDKNPDDPDRAKVVFQHLQDRKAFFLS